MTRVAIHSAVLAVAFVWSGCEKHVPVPRAGDGGTPRVGWVIMTGDQENPDRDFVCQSDPRTDCVVPASDPSARRFTDVHFYFHPAASDTKFTGTIRVGFFATPHEVTPPATVKGGDDPGRTSVVGVVAAVPGRYDMRIATIAESGGAKRELRESVPVTVQ